MNRLLKALIDMLPNQLKRKKKFYKEMEKTLSEKKEGEVEPMPKDYDDEVDVTKLIKKEIQSNDVVLFMKGTPAFPMCGFSAAITQMLTDLGVKFSSVNVLDSDGMREGIKKFSDWPTIPQLYVKEEFVGGCDIVKEMHENGELFELLNTKGIKTKPSK